MILKLLSEIQPQFTSHHIGVKQVLLSNDETPSNITQIAITTLRAGECVDLHIHKTMDEHYLFLSGNGRFNLGDRMIECKEGVFLMIPAGCLHGMEAIDKLNFITIGVALD